MQTLLQLPPQFNTREQLVYAYIRRAITLGKWGPNETIAAHRLAVELGASRITITSAFKRLAGEGFIRLHPHREAVVSPINSREIEDIYLCRAALESEAAYHACRKATDDQLRELRALNARIADIDPPEDVAAIRAADSALHRSIIAIADLPRLAELIGNLMDQCGYYRARLLDTNRLSLPSPAGHEALLAAMEARDSDAVRSLAREHVHVGMRTVLSALDSLRDEVDAHDAITSPIS